jgi:hypothetical protein
MPYLLSRRHASYCSDNGPQLWGEELMLSEHVNHAGRLPAAVAVTASLSIYRSLVRNPWRPLGQGSEPFMCPFRLNDGELNKPMYIIMIMIIIITITFMQLGYGSDVEVLLKPDSLCANVHLVSHYCVHVVGLQGYVSQWQQWYN